MQIFEPLTAGCYYHIYNHGVGGRDLFLQPENYQYFLGLYDKYISPIAETYAWCLMPNHFHLLVRITVFTDFTPDRVRNPVRGKIGKNNNELKIGTPSQQLSKLFNSYAQAYNKYHKTRGALFERPFRRKWIDNEDYLRRVILYIHNNPVHHGFCKHPIEYPWSSYLSCISPKNTKLQRNAVIDWFDGEINYKTGHDEHFNRKDMDDWLEL